MDLLPEPKAKASKGEPLLGSREAEEERKKAALITIPSKIIPPLISGQGRKGPRGIFKAVVNDRKGAFWLVGGARDVGEGEADQKGGGGGDGKDVAVKVDAHLDPCVLFWA